MNSGTDETDRSVGGASTLIKKENILNNNGELLINHPLSLNGITENDPDMMEINLNQKFIENESTLAANMETSAAAVIAEGKKKLNWVKFEDDDDDETINNDNGNIPKVITMSDNNVSNNIKNIENTNNNNNNNSSNNKDINLKIKTNSSDSGIQLILPPPVQANQRNKSTTPVSSAAAPSPASTIQVSSTPSTSSPNSNSPAAVLTTESVHVNLNNSSSSPHRAISAPTGGASSSSPSKNVSVAIPATPAMRTIELSTGRVREGFANGDIIVTLLPTNTKWPWITPAVFRPELVPEELMAQGLTLTVEEYVNAMETLVNDFRFTVYNVCYKRVLVCWILFAFCVLLTLLFSGLQGIALFALGVGWLFLNAAAIFFCMWIKLRLSRGLEKCLARVNKQLLRHKILLVLDDRGRLSCHKVNLCFMFFDPAQCIAFLNEFLERQEQNGNSIPSGWEKKLDIDVEDIVIQGSNPVRLSRKQAIAQEIFLTYLQRWGKDFLRRRLDWTVNEAGVHETPRHLMSSVCPCQYEEEILNSKIKLQQNASKCCGIRNPFKDL